MTMTGNSRLSWLSHWEGKLLGNTSCRCIIHFGIEPPIITFKLILLSTCGLMWETNLDSLFEQYLLFYNL
jgi:hypothetical protein